MFKKFAATSLLALTLGACATTGSNFPSRTEWIKKNVTKKDDVKLVMGTPFAVGNSGGVATWTYGFYKYQLFGKTHHKELKLYWNKDNSVKYYSFNSSFPEDISLLNVGAIAGEEEMINENGAKH